MRDSLRPLSIRGWGNGVRSRAEKPRMFKDICLPLFLGGIWHWVRCPMSKGLCLIAKETKQRCYNLNPFWNFVEKNTTILLKSGYVFFLLMKFAATLLATLAGGLCNTIRGRGLGLALCYGKDDK